MFRNRLGLALLLGYACAAHALPPVVQTRWPALRAQDQATLLARQARLQAMTPAQIDALRRRIAAWQALPIARRRARREAWQAWQALPIEQRAQLEAAAMRFAAMSDDAQRALRGAFDALDASEQRGWLLGPDLGGDYPRLQPLLAQVPAAQRDGLLALLRAMTPAERTGLAVLVQRTPPQQRDALRRDLLAVPRAGVAAWLRQRLDL